MTAHRCSSREVRTALIFRPGTGSRHRSARRWPVIRSRRTVGFLAFQAGALPELQNCFAVGSRCRCQTGPRPAGFAVRRAVVGCRLPGTSPTPFTAPTGWTSCDHDRAGHWRRRPANRATPRTRRVRWVALWGDLAKRELRRRSAQSAASTRPAVAPHTRCWSPDAIRARTPSHCPPARLPKSSVAGSAWGASEKRELSTDATPGQRVCVARAWWSSRPPGRVHHATLRRRRAERSGAFRPGSSAPANSRQSIQSKLMKRPG